MHMREILEIVERPSRMKLSKYVRDVTDRARKLGYGDTISKADIRAAYDSIMASAEFENGMMVIYRGMTIEDPSWFTTLVPGTNLGRYWAYDSQGAMDGSWDKPNVVLTALVKPEDINWPVTIAQEIVIGGEYEITLGGVEVILKDIRLIGDHPAIDFSTLYGAAFWT